MRELVHERALRVEGPGGRVYDRVLVYAEDQPGKTWAGWIEFVSKDGRDVVRSNRETTQSTVQGVAYWATGLEPVFFEGALQRALRRGTGEGERVGAPVGGGNIVRFRIETLDPLLPLDIMATHTLAPGLRRLVYNGGVIVYEGSARAPSAKAPGIYDFSAQFGSEVEAAVMANKLWTALHGRGARLLVNGTEVPIANGAIKDALTGVSVG